MLAFGNYLNSSKRGPAYGFKLQSLDTLLDTKSTDKRTCLLHYIVATVRQRFPDLLSFDAELYHVEQAALVSLENVVSDVQELEKGMEVVRKEADLRGKAQYSHVLKDFLQNSEEKLRKLRNDVKNAQQMFVECVEYFGESARTADASAFFALLARFIKAFKVSGCSFGHIYIWVVVKTCVCFLSDCRRLEQRPGERATSSSRTGSCAGREQARRYPSAASERQETAGERCGRIVLLRQFPAEL